MDVVVPGPELPVNEEATSNSSLIDSKTRILDKSNGKRNRRPLSFLDDTFFYFFVTISSVCVFVLVAKIIFKLVPRLMILFSRDLAPSDESEGVVV